MNIAVGNNNYISEQDAAKGLLGEAIKIINLCKIDYAVIGGWIPYLFYTQHYFHPGSFDADLLLNDITTTKEQMDIAVDIFREHGYLFSAKNKFQMHRILNVNGEPIIFHVDFLHRKYAPDQDQGMFLNWNKAVSIAGPGTDIIFSDNEIIEEIIEFILPDSTNTKIPICFASEIGFLSSKGRSLDSPKRVRDAYDVFLIICQSKDPINLLMQSAVYYKENNLFKISVDNIYDFFKNGNGVINAKKYLEQSRASVKYMPENLDVFISAKVCRFIEKVKKSREQMQ